MLPRDAHHAGVPDVARQARAAAGPALRPGLRPLPPRERRGARRRREPRGGGAPLRPPRGLDGPEAPGPGAPAAAPGLARGPPRPPRRGGPAPGLPGPLLGLPRPGHGPQRPLRAPRVLRHQPGHPGAHRRADPRRRRGGRAHLRRRPQDGRRDPRAAAREGRGNHSGLPLHRGVARRHDEGLRGGEQLTVPGGDTTGGPG
mmetsp:Transcript_51536/g.145255  ORF Transcript_51536/g.145255 Transcript_51536/m.145255 type:complete len:201 (-) Transcript_51536:726-1328(-)